MRRFENRVVVITGAASGIGAESARQFCAEGGTVVVADINARGIDETVDALRAAGGQTSVFAVDVSVPEQVQAMIRHALDVHGRVDVLCNNAFAQETGPLADISVEGWQRTLDVTLKGTFLGTKYALPAMLAQGGGVIINTSSAAAIQVDLYISAYCAAKAGVIALTQSTALEYGRQGIRCLAICPGAVRTPALTAAFGLDSGSDTATYKRALNTHVLGRLGEPTEIARAILFLASDEASFMTGTSVAVDGGYLVQKPGF